MGRRPLAALIAAVALAGCGSDEETAGETTAPPPPPPPAATSTGEEPAETEPAPGTVVNLYYLDAEQEQVRPVLGLTEPTTGVAADALRLLLKNEDANPTAIPGGTKLLDLAVAEGGATVDLSGDFSLETGRSMPARVAQVVFTLTQWPTIRSVSFRLDGEDVGAVGGVPAQNVTRADLPREVVPAIVVDRPAANTFSVSPLKISGDASVFEANVSLRLEEANGRKLAEGFATAAEGAPGRGAFEAALDFDVAKPTDGVLVAYESSAEDASEQHVVRVPIRLCPAGTASHC